MVSLAARPDSVSRAARTGANDGIICAARQHAVHRDDVLGDEVDQVADARPPHGDRLGDDLGDAPRRSNPACQQTGLGGGEGGAGGRLSGAVRIAVFQGVYADSVVARAAGCGRARRSGARHGHPRHGRLRHGRLRHGRLRHGGGSEAAATSFHGIFTGPGSTRRRNGKHGRAVRPDLARCHP